MAGQGKHASADMQFLSQVGSLELLTYMSGTKDLWDRIRLRPTLRDLLLLSKCSRLVFLRLAKVFPASGFAALRFLPALRSFAAFASLRQASYLGRLPRLEELALHSDMRQKRSTSIRLDCDYLVACIANFSNLRLLAVPKEAIADVRVAVPELTVVYFYEFHTRTRFHLHAFDTNKTER